MLRHQLFALLCHSQQAVPALPQQLYSQHCLLGTRHARFLYPSSQTSSERAQVLPTVQIFLTEKVHVGIGRNRAVYPQNGGQAAVVDAWAVHGIWWIANNNLRTSFKPPGCQILILCTWTKKWEQERVNQPDMRTQVLENQTTQAWVGTNRFPVFQRSRIIKNPMYIHKFQVLCCNQVPAEGRRGLITIFFLHRSLFFFSLSILLKCYLA